MREWDEYRVMLFKKKIRAALPAMKGIRFGRSKGRCHLILDVKWRYSHADEVMEYVLTGLKAAGIEGKAQAMFECFPGPDYVSIPIDQAALSERYHPLARRKLSSR